MKKITIKTTLIFLVLIIGVVAYFAYLSTKSRDRDQEADMRAVQLVLSRDLENNYPPTVKDVTVHLLQLKSEITSFQEDSKKITAVSVASSANVDTFTEDGYEFARIHCMYTILADGQSSLVDMVYLLRRGEDRRWKIYGWDLAQNVNPGE